MNNVESVEVKAKTVDLAVEVAMTELGADSRDQVNVEIVTEPVKGFLGMGGQDAVVRVEKKKGRRRRNNRRKGQSRDQRNQQGGGGQQSGGKQKQSGGGRHTKGSNQQRGSSGSAKNGSSDSAEKPKKQAEKPKRAEKRDKPVSDDRPVLTIEEQATITKDFLVGLLEAYGLEGEVTATIDDDVIIADVSGEQTEALVGVRGSVRTSIHELTRTVLQRYGQDTARLRLDIAGYAERRRQALSIYAEQLIDQLDAEGGEIMLEPMSPADRKVIHDVAASREGISSYSEGEPPRRFVVLSKEASSEEE